MCEPRPAAGWRRVAVAPTTGPGATAATPARAGLDAGAAPRAGADQLPEGGDVLVGDAQRQGVLGAGAHAHLAGGAAAAVAATAGAQQQRRRRRAARPGVRGLGVRGPGVRGVGVGVGARGGGLEERGHRGDEPGVLGAFGSRCRRRIAAPQTEQRPAADRWMGHVDLAAGPATTRVGGGVRRGAGQDEARREQGGEVGEALPRLGRPVAPVESQHDAGRAGGQHFERRVPRQLGETSRQSQQRASRPARLAGARVLCARQLGAPPRFDQPRERRGDVDGVLGARGDAGHDTAGSTAAASCSQPAPSRATPR